jgi:hypothetical protein
MADSTPPCMGGGTRTVSMKAMSRKTVNLSRSDDEHSVLIRRDGGPQSTYIFLTSMKHIQRWMSKIPDDKRHLYYTNLTLCQDVTTNGVQMQSMFKAAFVCAVTWFSLDDQPDPLTSARIRALHMAMTKAVETMRNTIQGFLKYPSPCDGSDEVNQGSVVDFGTLALGKSTFKNSLRVSMPDVIFANTGPRCLGDFVSKLLIPLAMREYRQLLSTSTTDSDTKCILDPTIYDGACELLMPGCCDRGEPGRPMASLKKLDDLKPDYNTRALTPMQQEYRAITTEDVQWMIRVTEKNNRSRCRIATAAVDGADGRNTNKKQKTSHMVLPQPVLTPPPIHPKMKHPPVAAMKKNRPANTECDKGKSRSPAPQFLRAFEEAAALCPRTTHVLRQWTIRSDDDERDDDESDDEQVEPNNITDNWHAEVVACDEMVEVAAGTNLVHTTEFDEMFDDDLATMSLSADSLLTPQACVDLTGTDPPGPPATTASIAEENGHMKEQVVVTDDEGEDAPNCEGQVELEDDAPCMPDPKTLCVPLPEPHPVFDSEPEPTSEPVQEPEPQLVHLPIPESEPEPEPDPEPQPRPVSKHLADNQMSDAANTIANWPADTDDKDERMRFLTRDELANTRVMDLHGHQEATTYTHIAELLPPQFVTHKEQFTIEEYSLSKKGFLEVVNGDGYQKLCNFVSLVKRSGMEGEQLEGKDTHATLCTAGDIIHTEKVTQVVQTLCVLLSSHQVDAYAIQGVSQVLHDTSTCTDVERKDAYEWMAKNWKSVQDVTKPAFWRNMMMQTVPDRDLASTDETWVALFKHVLLTQLGIGCRFADVANTCSSSSSTPTQTRRIQMRAVSFWQKMGVDIPALVAWTRERRTTPYGPLPVVLKPCVVCEGATLDQTRCWVQRGAPRCALHRDRSEPLDTNTPAVDNDDMAMLVGDHPVIAGVETDKKPEYIVDRLLRYVGYPDGRRSTNYLTETQMVEAVRTSASLTKAELNHVKRSYGHDIHGWADASTIKRIRRQLSSIVDADEQTDVSCVYWRRVTNGIRMASWELR